MLGAAAVAPWLPEAIWVPGLVAVSGVVALRFGRLPALFFVCLLWCLWRLSPGVDDLRRLRPLREATARLEFVVAGDARDFEEEGEAPVSWAPVRVTSMWTLGGFRPAEGRVQLQLTGRRPSELHAGTRWRASGVLEPENVAHVGLRRAHWRFRVRAADLEREGAHGVTGRTWRWFFGVRERLAKAIQRANPHSPAVAEVLQALLLGQRGELDGQTRDRFARTGLIHLFAVSGLHLTLLAGMMDLLCRGVGIPLRIRAAILLPCLWVFTLCTGLRASALRAFVMIACAVLACVWYRRPRLLSAFALSAFLIVAAAPEQVYALGFQYSFLLVGSLLAFGRLAENTWAGWTAPDPWAPATRFGRFMDQRVRTPIRNAWIVSVLCLAMSAPLTAYTFHLFSPVALIGNLLAVPLVVLLLATGFPAMVVLAGPSEWAEWAFFPARLSGRALLGWVEAMEAVPYGIHWVRAPEGWVVAVFYATVFAWWVRPDFKRAWAGVLLALAGYVGTNSWFAYHRTELTVLDADRGQAAWLRGPGKGTVVIDCGSDWSGRALATRLREAGIDRVDALILTHPDRYHVGGVDHLSGDHAPEVLYVSETDAEHALYKGLPHSPRRLKAGDCLEIGGWTVDVLWPPAQADGRAARDRSLVVRFRDGFASVLFLGGAGGQVESRLVSGRRENLATRLLVAGHTREDPGGTSAFLSASAPEAIVYSGNGYGGPTPARLQSEARAVRQGVTVLRVPEEGLLRLDVEKGVLLAK